MKWDVKQQIEGESLREEMQSLITDNEETKGKEIEKYLSLVVTARNDNHGGNMLHRMQVFINSLFLQCNKNKLNVELIIVEWNPPQNKKRLSEVIKWPEPSSQLTVRFIVVPLEIHSQIENSDKIPLFQMIAKNVGIRRARGKFVLATNIDIVFSDELMWFFAQNQLDPRSFYRIDRYDVGSKVIPGDLTVEEQLEFCRQNVTRVHRLHGTEEIAQGEKNSRFADGKKLHTNACGDFTLMSKTKWCKLRGYPELGLNDLYIDGLIIYMGEASGMKQVILSHPMEIYHINHQLSFSDHSSRLKRCQHLDYDKEYRPWCEKMLQEKCPLNPNDGNWGLADEELREYFVCN